MAGYSGAIDKAKRRITATAAMFGADPVKQAVDPIPLK